MRFTACFAAATRAIILCVLSRQSFAQGWQLTSAPTNVTWVAVAMSADGNKLAAASTNGPIYLSTNFGAAWQLSKAPLDNWSAIASSADGTKLAAVAGSYLGVGPIYTSTNSGLDWISNATPRRAWSCVAASADGSKLMAGAMVYEAYQTLPGPLFTSTNSGATWQSNNVPLDFWSSVAASADGTRLLAGSAGGNLYSSTNSGLSWITNSLVTRSPSFSPYWMRVACSADGSLVAAATGQQQLYLSTNSGASWGQSPALPGPVTQVLCSPDGRRMVTLLDAWWVSEDLGATWAPMPSQTSSPPASLDAWSADGSRCVGRNWGSNSGGLFTVIGIATYQTTQRPLLNIRSAGGRLTLSWLAPSTSASLQRSVEAGAANWETLTNVPILNLSNLQSEVVLPASGDRGFYRLREP